MQYLNVNNTFIDAASIARPFAARATSAPPLLNTDNVNVEKSSCHFYIGDSFSETGCEYDNIDSDIDVIFDPLSGHDIQQHIFLISDAFCKIHSLMDLVSEDDP